MKTVDYDALATSAPLNKDAALARDGRGSHWDPKIPKTQAHWDAPPPMKPPPVDRENFTGRTFGWLTVVGYYDSHKKVGSRWVVRCRCGDYETRSGKAVRNSAADACCYECGAALDLRKAEEFRRTGKQRERESYM